MPIIILELDNKSKIAIDLHMLLTYKNMQNIHKVTPTATESTLILLQHLCYGKLFRFTIEEFPKWLNKIVVPKDSIILYHALE